MILLALVTGPRGHPVHPPLTDATIGAWTVASIAALLDVTGWVGRAAAQAWWIALLVGLGFAIPTALTGLADWLRISSGTPLKRTATLHLAAMVTATALFAAGAAIGHAAYRSGDLDALRAALTFAGFAALTVGGWIGGAVVYVHGMRVEGRRDEPTRSATT